MNEITHKREFSNDPDLKAAREKTEAALREMAGRYAAVFLGTEVGRMVLADLRGKFGLGRLCFTKNDSGRFDYLAAAVTDGQRSVMSEVESMLRLSRPESPEVKDANLKP